MPENNYDKLFEYDPESKVYKSKIPFSVWKKVKCTHLKLNPLTDQYDTATGWCLAELRIKPETPFYASNQNILKDTIGVIPKGTIRAKSAHVKKITSMDSPGSPVVEAHSNCDSKFKYVEGQKVKPFNGFSSTPEAYNAGGGIYAVTSLNKL